MLNWKADEQRRQARVAEMVERTLAQPMQQATQKDSFKRGERTTGKVKHDWTNWDVDLSVIPDNVRKVDGYFRSNKVDTIHHIATEPTKVKKVAKKVAKKADTKTYPTITTITIPVKTKATLRIVDGKRVWTYHA